MALPSRNGLLAVITGRLGKETRQVSLDETVSALQAAEGKGTESYGGIHVRRSYHADGGGYFGTGNGWWVALEPKRLIPDEAADFLAHLFTPSAERAALGFANGTYTVDRMDSCAMHEILIDISWPPGTATSEKVKIEYTTT